MRWKDAYTALVPLRRLRDKGGLPFLLVQARKKGKSLSLLMLVKPGSDSAKIRTLLDESNIPVVFQELPDCFADAEAVDDKGIRLFVKEGALFPEIAFSIVSTRRKYKAGKVVVVFGELVVELPADEADAAALVRRFEQAHHDAQYNNQEARTDRFQSDREVLRAAVTSLMACLDTWTEGQPAPGGVSTDYDFNLDNGTLLLKAVDGNLSVTIRLDPRLPR